MKSVFDREVRNETIKRIRLLTAENKSQWGKMTVTQMLKHCSLCEEYYYGKIKVDRSLLGRVLGRIALKAILKNDKVLLGQNSTSPSQLTVTEDIQDFETWKGKWISLIEKYETFENENFTHWFFGNMTKAQLGQFIYKHSDHHLRQFGV